MKIYNLLFALAVIIFFGCQDGYIDDINAVEPGPDEATPSVQINYPLEGTEVRVVEDVATITINFKTSDDIELKTVEVMLDGEKIATYDEFLDYRNFTVNNLVYEGLTNGDHTLTVEVTDMSGKTGSKTVTFKKVEPYQPMDGEVFYLPFDGEYVDLVTLTNGTVVGSPTYSTDDAVAGLAAYKGATDAYLTFPTAGLRNSAFSASFWMKVNADPNRAGILVMGPPHDGNTPDKQNNRTGGFRFFREDAGGEQRFKLNVGNGAADAWFDGGENADIAPAEYGDWHHFAFTISPSTVTVYIDGEVVSSGAFPGINWNGCDVLSIMSGAPRFTEWGHYSDQSLMDELRIFDKALTQEEVQAIMNAEMPN